MNILGMIIVITGIALIFAGRLTRRSLPPDYHMDADDGFFKLLDSVAKFLERAGGVFVLIGMVCILLSLR